MELKCKQNLLDTLIELSCLAIVSSSYEWNLITGSVKHVSRTKFGILFFEGGGGGGCPGMAN